MSNDTENKKIMKPVVLIPELGEQGLLPDGGIINAGGVVGPGFTVGGKGVVLADGTTSGGSGTNGSNVTGFEHVQLDASVHWVISHNRNTEKIHITIWDTDNEVIYPDVAKIANAEIVHIMFSSPQAGRAILVMF